MAAHSYKDLFGEDAAATPSAPGPHAAPTGAGDADPAASASALAASIIGNGIGAPRPHAAPAKPQASAHAPGSYKDLFGEDTGDAAPAAAPTSAPTGAGDADPAASASALAASIIGIGAPGPGEAPPPSYAGGLLDQAANSASLGAYDYLQAAGERYSPIAYMAHKLLGQSTDASVYGDNKYGFGDVLKSLHQQGRSFAAENPKASLAANLAGGLALGGAGVAGGGAKALASLSELPSLGSAVWSGIKGGAALGAATGGVGGVLQGDSLVDGSLGGVAADAAGGALAGGVLGGGLGGVGAGMSNALATRAANRVGLDQYGVGNRVSSYLSDMADSMDPGRAARIGEISDDSVTPADFLSAATRKLATRDTAAEALAGARLGTGDGGRSNKNVLNAGATDFVNTLVGAEPIRSRDSALTNASRSVTDPLFQEAFDESHLPLELGDAPARVRALGTYADTGAGAFDGKVRKGLRQNAYDVSHDNLMKDTPPAATVPDVPPSFAPSDEGAFLAPPPPLALDGPPGPRRLEAPPATPLLGPMKPGHTPEDIQLPPEGNVGPFLGKSGPPAPLSGGEAGFHDPRARFPAPGDDALEGQFHEVEQKPAAPDQYSWKPMTLQALHTMLQDKTGGAWQEGSGFGNSLLRRIEGIWKDQMVQESPTYDKALQAWEQGRHASDMREYGLDALSKDANFAPEELARLFDNPLVNPALKGPDGKAVYGAGRTPRFVSNMDPDAQAAYADTMRNVLRSGVVDHLADQVNNSANTTGVLQDIANTQAKRAKYQTILGEDKAQALFDRGEWQKMQTDTGQAVTGGSKTANNLAADQALDGHTAPVDLNVMSKEHAYSKLLGKVVNGAVGHFYDRPSSTPLDYRNAVDALTQGGQDHTASFMAALAGHKGNVLAAANDSLTGKGGGFSRGLAHTRTATSNGAFGGAVAGDATGELDRSRKKDGGSILKALSKGGKRA